MKLVTLALAAATFLATVEAGKSRSRRSSLGSTSIGKPRSTSLGKPRTSIGKKLAGGALIGAGAYVGYKAAKATAKFATLPFRARTNLGYDFDQWEQWSNSQGFLCRGDQDCWLSPDLECRNQKLDFEPSNAWFGGDVISIRGQCGCRQGTFVFDGNVCRPQGLGVFGQRGGTTVVVTSERTTFPLWGIILIIVFLVIPCCCCLACCCVYKVFK